MCRYDPVTKTERRCPSYLDKESYNAKRRARYHAKKNGSAFITTVKDNEPTQVSPTASLMQEKTFDFDKSMPIFQMNILGDRLQPVSESNDMKPYEVSDDYETVDSLNVQVREATGSFAESKYFNRAVFQGQIDHTQLDENSYKTFFKPVEEALKPKSYENHNGETITNIVFMRDDLRFTADMDILMKISALETQKMSKNELKALTFFSSNNYKWLNEGIYTHGAYLTQTYDEPDDVLKANDFYGVQKSSANATIISKLLDSALAKGPKIQRTLYRGVNKTNNMFNGRTPKEWVQNLNLGQELVFDGYQSASQDYYSGYGYASREGVLFEIITPEGVQISDCSEYSTEKETLLPRDSRYQVVGVHEEIINKENNKVKKLSVVQLVAINSKGEILDGSNSDKPKPLNLSKAKN